MVCSVAALSNTSSEEARELRRSRRKRCMPTQKAVQHNPKLVVDQPGKRATKSTLRTVARCNHQTNQKTRGDASSIEASMSMSESIPAPSQISGGGAVMKAENNLSKTDAIYKREYMRKYRIIQRERLQSLPESDKQLRLEKIRAGVRERVRRFRLRKSLGITSEND
uniref:Uncharacterized protein n=1 Tax=Spongospora subterranea TaxID=70186 RepID=A0A0H5R8N6_9EUKA|eukprot:CRZ10488.1 hypothetical protein [Spongospora subterranea]